jgi:5-methylcytosine-specific restriction endonuclease McrA
MTYQEQIKHPKWQKRRLEILERDLYTCQHCNNKEKTLHVHHFYYEKILKIWEYPDDALITYCNVCHDEWHKIKSEIDKRLRIDPEGLSEINKLVRMTSWLVNDKQKEITDIVKSILNFCEIL